MLANDDCFAKFAKVLPRQSFTLYGIYHFTVVLFGSVSSPFMLNANLQLILNKDGSVVANDI